MKPRLIRKFEVRLAALQRELDQVKALAQCGLLEALAEHHLIMCAEIDRKTCIVTDAIDALDMLDSDEPIVVALRPEIIAGVKGILLAALQSAPIAPDHREAA